MTLAALFATFLAFPTSALAHASDRGHALLLPTGHHIAGGAAAVAASFLGLVLLPSGSPGRIAAARLPLFRLQEWLKPLVSLASFAVLLVSIAAGFLGSRDPLSNPLPLVVWTLLWVGPLMVAYTVPGLGLLFTPTAG